MGGEHSTVTVVRSILERNKNKKGGIRKSERLESFNTYKLDTATNQLIYCHNPIPIHHPILFPSYPGSDLPGGESSLPSQLTISQ